MPSRNLQIFAAFPSCGFTTDKSVKAKTMNMQEHIRGNSYGGPVVSQEITLTDLGDACIETRQHSPVPPIQIDNMYGWGPPWPFN